MINFFTTAIVLVQFFSLSFSQKNFCIFKIEFILSSFNLLYFFNFIIEIS